MQVETSAALKAGGLSGVPVDAGIVLMLMLAERDVTESTFSQLVVRYGLSASVFQLEASVYLVLVLLALVVFVPLGMLAGIIFLRTVNRVRNLSIYIRAPAFAFLLWIIALLLTHNTSLIYPTWYADTLVLFLADSFVFAFLFNLLTRTKLHGQE